MGRRCDSGNRPGVGGRQLTGLSEATEELCLLYSTEPTPVSLVTGCGDEKREGKGGGMETDFKFCSKH